jgi:hypothetical protein
MTPDGKVQVPEDVVLPVVNVITQSFPTAFADAVNPETVGVQLLSVKASALGAVTTEIAESVETAKTKGINEATKRRALRMKVARFNAIPMYSFTDATGDYPFLTRKCLNEWNISPRNPPPLSKNERGE